MSRPSANRRRPAVHISLGRAARLHHLVMYVAEAPRSRDDVLVALRVGLRTFYRELELLRRCGVKVQHKDKAYSLQATAAEAEGRLPFPDPQLSFAEMAELARGPGDAARRLAEMLARVVDHAAPATRAARKRGGKSPKAKGQG